MIPKSGNRFSDKIMRKTIPRRVIPGPSPESIVTAAAENAFDRHNCVSCGYGFRARAMRAPE
jgi:hypothetical protein